MTKEERKYFNDFFKECIMDAVEWCQTIEREYSENPECIPEFIKVCKFRNRNLITLDEAQKMITQKVRAVEWKKAEEADKANRKALTEKYGTPEEWFEPWFY